MPRYSTSLSPPGPLATVRVVHPATGAESDDFAGKHLAFEMRDP